MKVYYIVMIDDFNQANFVQIDLAIFSVYWK